MVFSTTANVFDVDIAAAYDVFDVDITLTTAYVFDVYEADNSKQYLYVMSHQYSMEHY